MSSRAFLQASAHLILRTAQPARRWLRIALPFTPPAALLAWELTVRILRVPIYLVPPPSRIFAVLWSERAIYLQAAMATLWEAMAGLALGMGIALGLAVAATFYPPLERAVMPLVLLLKAIPLVAIAPILTLWFGFGPIPKVLMTALLTFYPALVSWMTGLQAVDPAALELMRAWNASDWEILRHLRWPSAWPYTFTALKTAVPLAFIGAVVAEWAGASGGLGRAMWLAQTNLDMPRLFAGAFLLAAMSLTGYGLAAWGERRVAWWRA
ncbi:ABC transporter permease [Thermoflexus sp.]|uniref:ABC transporter permease n=1 Tax=Thermoflexus sp. TaxID=1969742 RepID=UPI002ADE7C3C|nr:ABC transporter permease [Thermoflexus sp.]